MVTKIIGSFAGDMVEAHKVGCNFVKEIARVKKYLATLRFQRMADFHLIKTFIKQLKG